MPNQADVTIKNILEENTDINVIRKLQNGSSDVNINIAYNNESTINLPSPDVSLIVSAPGVTEIRKCHIDVKSDVDLEVVKSRTFSNWTFKIIPNALPPDVPTTVNIGIGPKEPE